MAFRFEQKAPPQPARGQTADVKAERLRIARQSAELAQRRRERIAAVRAGRLSRQELDASERLLLASYEKATETEQRPGFFERLSRRIAGSALGTLIASIITATASAPTTCGGSYNPFLLRVAGVLGGLGLVVLAVAAAVWVYRHLFL